jgi:Cohesin domain.
MKKIFTIFMLILTISFANFTAITDVLAADAKISVTGTKTVIVGNTVKITVTISSSNALGSWEFDLKYDTDKLTLVSSTLEGGTRSANSLTNSNTKSKTYTLTFRAKKSGNAKIYITNSLVYGWNETKMNTTNGSLTLNLVTQAEVEASYSTNNDLKSLSVDGHTISPVFNKDTLEYDLELENGVESIVVKATKADAKATVSGAGTHKLTEGENKITVSVMAENGKVKKYVINAKVKELNPITIKIDDKEYNVIRKADDLEIPSTFIETKTLIDGEEVPAFESSITGYQLIAVKNTEGDIEFFINKGNGEYTLYEEILFSGVILYPLTPIDDIIPDGYMQSGSIIINDITVITYSSDNNNFPLIYGMNIETGEKNWYTYDTVEKTLQRFEETKQEVVESNDKYLILVMLLGGSSFILVIFLTVLGVKLRSARRKEG